MKNEFKNQAGETINRSVIETALNFSREDYNFKVKKSRVERRDFDDFLNECVEIARDQECTIDQISKYADDIYENHLNN